LKPIVPLALTVLFLTAPMSRGASFPASQELTLEAPISGCYELGATGAGKTDPLLQRMLRYMQIGLEHRVAGLASYYSGFFDGRKTANGELEPVFERQ